ncbi:TIGR03943 family putative permease subunit [Streptantibioticus ferralitis]|uniref:TIGR03943 family protein n=1 Tax=Streptantibioticus ferralitis TaxID=236510 RepID=A0ABT5YVJ9_9ACTN|nr:TIGR03943 family protein [Streptantibioticus ferralitis]MDF2255626.1 TIGR03943 family protein [Streptantibioticus ferralitis]
MKREVQAVLLVLFGATVLRISLFSDDYLRYVRTTQRPYLIAAGAVLVLLGVVSAVVAMGALVRGDTSGGEHPAGHDHRHSGHGGPRIAWLLTLPVLAVFLIAPPALGSYTAGRSDNAAPKPTADSGFPPLAAGDPLAMPLADFDSRAVWDKSHSLKGRRVKLTGFVTPEKGGGWFVTRLYISCCAADAQTYKVEVRGTDAPPANAWVEVTGVWQPNGQAGRDDAVPALTAQRVTRIQQPRDPYE